jgi:hypothetical protein
MATRFPIFAVARLQLRLLTHKRAILVLLTIWIVRFLLLVQLGATGLPSPVVVQLLVPTLLVTDLLVVAMTCGLIADDAEQGTFPFVLANGIERRTFLAGKLLAIVGVALAFATLAHIATVTLPGAPSRPLADAMTRVVLASTLSLARLLVVATATAWLAVLFTTRQLVVMGALLYVYGLAALLHAVVAPNDRGVWLVESVLPWRDAFERVAESLFTGRIDVTLLATSLIQPVAYAAIFFVLATRRLERRDLVRAS